MSVFMIYQLVGTRVLIFLRSEDYLTILDDIHNINSRNYTLIAS